jgi:membrane protein YdbS with pleckstrin-like domain
MNKRFPPSSALRTKFYYVVILVFVLGFLPWLLLTLAPDIGWAFVAIYLAANAVWIVVAVVLIPPYFRSIEYELDEDEIIVRKGIVTKTEKMVPYRMVTNVAIRRDPLDRLLGMGSVQVHTAGYSQQTNAEASLSGLGNYREVHAAIMEALRQYRAESAQKAPTGSAEPSEVSRDTRQLLADILAEVKAMRGGM